MDDKKRLQRLERENYYIKCTEAAREFSLRKQKIAVDPEG